MIQYLKKAQVLHICKSLGHVQHNTVNNLEVKTSERYNSFLASFLVLVNPVLQVLPAAATMFTVGRRFPDCLDCFIINDTEHLICSCGFESAESVTDPISAFFDVPRLTLQNLEEWLCEAENGLEHPEQEDNIKILKFLLQSRNLRNALFVPSRLLSLCH